MLRLRSDQLCITQAPRLERRSAGLVCECKHAMPETVPFWLMTTERAKCKVHTFVQSLIHLGSVIDE
jgi:hypothetical protein